MTEINFIYPEKFNTLMGKQVPRTRTNHHTHIQENTVTSLQDLSLDDSNLTSSMVIASIHTFCRKKHKEINKIRKQAIEILQICRVCDDWGRNGSIMTCETCEDHYHKKCYKGPVTQSINGNFVCYLCLGDGKLVNCCQTCKKSIKAQDKTNKCESCLYEYHSNCFDSKLGLCKRCAKIKRLVRKLAKKKGKQIENQESKEKQPKISEMFQMIAAKINYSNNISKNFLMNRQGCQFLSPDLINENDTTLIKKYKRQLLTAIQKKGMNYTQQLIDFDIRLNQIQGESLDFGLANMSKMEEKEYLRYKEQPIGPFNLILHPQKGFDVVADADIPKYTLICEYVGQVVTLRQCIELNKFSHNDSIMELWNGRNSDESLVIRPEKWTNIARYLNGVGRKKENINVISIRMCFRGRPLVLLVANRKIKKGQSLCYEYNGGGNPEKYDTSYFS